ncbi:MAG: T7SS effector LXG polymorphic toxin [Sporolactobacillus sp.]
MYWAIRYDAKALIQAAEARAKQYQTLDEEMRQLKQSFILIIALGLSFKGRGAEKIKAFYQAQETVVNAWLRLIEKQVAFLNGIAGEIADRNLGGATQVQIPFLESDLSIAYWRSRDVVNDQKESINKVLNSISDLIPVGKLNTEDVERQLDKANKAQTKMSEDVRELDRTLLNEYQQVISDVPQIVSLYSALENATHQGADVEPLHFNAEIFYHSDAYKIQGDLEKQTTAYLSFKKRQEQARQVSKKEEEAVNRPWYETAGTGIATFAGEMSGYYDFIRATEGIDPETGRKLSASERALAAASAASMFIPFVGWAGRAVKGGEAIYRTAKGLNAAGHALDAVGQSERTFQVLSKSEIGLQSLLATANVSEAATGRDLDGNKLTDDQRRNSLLMSLMMMKGLSASRAAVTGESTSAQTLVKGTKELYRKGEQKLSEVLPNKDASQLAFAGEAGAGGKVEASSTGSVHETHQMAKAERVDGINKTEEKSSGKGSSENKEGIRESDLRVNPFDEEGHLKRNIKYRTGEFNYKYETDELGRISKFETDDLQLTSREERLPHNPDTPGKLDGDHAGHLAGDRFGGSPELDNLVSQSSNVNLSQYKKIENQWAKAIEEDKQVKVNVEIIYDEDSLRPSKFNVQYEIDGKYFERDILN